MKIKPLKAARWHMEFIERVERISPVTGKWLGDTLVFTDQMPDHYLGTIMQRRDWTHRLRLQWGFALSLSDLRTITKRIQQLDEQAAQDQLQEAPPPH